MSLKVLKYFILISAILAIGTNFFGITKVFFVLKPLTSSLIILMAVLYSTANQPKFNMAIIIGLFFCLLGDIFLLFQEYFVFGLASFLVGHIFFIFAFTAIKGWNWQLKIGIPLVFIGGTIFVLSYPNLASLFIPVMVYMIIIIIMSWQGIFLQISSPKKAFKTLGFAVSLFVLSDGLLALDKFYVSFPLSGLFILITYWFAIFLLAEATTKEEV